MEKRDAEERFSTALEEAAKPQAHTICAAFVDNNMLLNRHPCEAKIP